jgi:excisionase family DNA binding protein
VRAVADWFTLPEAAERLGISVSTARRWIREGKLSARKEPGPYGLEYRIPADQITTAQEIKEVIQVEHPVDLAHVAVVLDEHLRGRDAEIASKLDLLRQEVIETVRAEVREASQKQFEQVERLQAELASTQSELRSALEALSTPRPSWWQRLFSWWSP